MMNMARLTYKLLCAALLWAMLAVATAPLALAVEPDEVLSNAAQEQRAREISAKLRCVVCQNQSIDDSNAPLARGMRVLVRERIVAGDSNEQVVSALVSKYGEFVLLKPRFAPHTLLLWLAPLGMLLFGAYYFRQNLMNRKAAPAGKAPKIAELSEEEKEKLAKLMKEE